MSAKRICIEKDKKTSDDDKVQKVVINSLDYDSLAQIFMLLPVPERIDIEGVCVKWKEACQLSWYNTKKYKCESSIGRAYDNRLLTQSYLEKILSRCGKYLEELSLSDVCNSSIMPFVGENCKNLTSLECDVSMRSLIYNADHFVQAFTQLDKLKCIKIIVNCQNNDKTINIFALINSLPKEINEIHLFFESLLDQKQTCSMTIEKFKNLKKLTIHSLRLDEIILQEIAEKTTLVHLNIQLYDLDVRLFSFDKLVNLEHIELTQRMHGSSYEASRELSAEVLYTIFCTCKNLKHLDIVHFRNDVAEIPLEKWISFQNLQYLAISCNMTPDLADTIVKYCKNLKHLRINNRHHIINTALKTLTELENLECLILLNCIKLNEESIIAISNNCKKLKRLEISIRSIYDPPSSLSDLDEISKLQYLEHLKLCIGKSLKDSTIIAIANNCKYLKSLEIAGCSAITETALVALTKLENLQKLDVSFLHITNSFISKLKGLKELHCDFCEQLTEAGFIQLIKNNPDLKEISVLGTDSITIDLVIAADQAIKHRTNGIILHIRKYDLELTQAFKSIIKSQWLVVK